MLYQREIEDSVLIQFIILFTLYSADEEVGYDDLLNLVLENCNISFTDFQLALDNLITTNHVSAAEVNERRTLYDITDKGKNTSDFFLQTVPVYIREPIKESIKNLFIEKRRKEAVRAKITPINRKEYRAECSLYDDDKMQLLELNLYAGGRDEAEKMARRFKADHINIYEQILRLMSEEKTTDTKQ